MGDRLSDAEIVRRLQVAAGKSQAAAAAEIGISGRVLRETKTLAKERGLSADTPIIDEKEKLRIALKQVQRDLKAAQERIDTEEKIREEIFNLASRSPEPPAWLTKSSGKIGQRGTPVCLWSDWHFGEVVRPEEVGGVNSFNTEIAIDRVRRLVDTTIDLSYNHMGRAKTAYPGVVINLGGDMMTGDIHEELALTNDRTPQEQINDLTDTLAAAIERMASAFGKAFVPCVVGNHGRDGKKRRTPTKMRVRSAHEWIIYTNLERYFRKTKNVVIHVSPESDVYYKVYGHRYLLTHGDGLGVKGGDGIIGAIGPIMRGSLKTARSESQIGRDFDTIIMGHWHQMLWLPGCIVNSSLKGYDEYARLILRAPYSRPSQALWFTHPEHGITAKWEVFLEGRRDAQEGKEWVSFEQGRAA